MNARQITRRLAEAIGDQVGNDIATLMLANCESLKWPGLDAQNRDQFLEAGLAPNTEWWHVAEVSAYYAYRTATYEARMANS